jgi:hypothetical protein
MPEHVHVHAPHELSEPGEAVSSRERVFEIVAALLMSIATLGIAWSGYQAARWSGVQSERYTEASAARSLANRQGSLVNEQRLQDITTFDRWLELALAEKGDRLEAHAAVEFAIGKQATKHADGYVFATLFFAAVLFFAGMSLRFAWPMMHSIVLGMGVVLLVYGLIRLAGMPVY